MTLNLAELLGTPDHYLHSFDGGNALFVPMGRAAYARSIFLDHRIAAAGEGGWRVPVAELPAAVPAAQPMGWIFHVAHCGSTLLARALDQLGGGLVLREPLALRQLALEPDATRLDSALALLSRRYPGGGPTLAKANVPVNFLLAEIAAADPAAPALFLHLGLADYLLAILRSDNHRAWLRQVTSLLAAHLGDLAGASDAERAAALWLAQQRQFAAALARMPNARSLDAELFFAQPERTLAAAAVLFGRPADEAAIAALVAGPLFATYAKNPAHAFDNAARLARRDHLQSDLANELLVAEQWLAGAAPDAAAIAARVTHAALQV